MYNISREKKIREQSIVNRHVSRKRYRQVPHLYFLPNCYVVPLPPHSETSVRKKLLASRFSEA